MTEDGYPDEEELEKIAKWDIMDTFGQIEFIKNLWCYNHAIVEKWKKDIFYLELHTCGWSGNEDIIYALQKSFFFTMYHEKWLRGGHYYFKINPRGCRYRKVSEFAKEKGISKQAIHKLKEKYDWLQTGTLLYVRDKI